MSLFFHSLSLFFCRSSFSRVFSGHLTLISERRVFSGSLPPAATHPMPQSSQQVRRSSAEICTLTLAPLWMHSRSDMASTAPKAWTGAGGAGGWVRRNETGNGGLENEEVSFTVLPTLCFFASHPAGAAGALVPDLPHCGALGPLLTCVKGVWEPHAVGVMKPVGGHREQQCGET